VRRSAAALALATGLACGGSGESKPAPAPEARAQPSPVPAGSLRGDAAAGKILYGQVCAVCHGAGGKGDGPTAAALFPRPADHTDPAYMKTLADEHLYRVIHGGGAAIGRSPLMPPWGGALNEQDIKDVVAYVRSLSGT
jgi:mono/diheme cytochrome c family protein